MKTITFTLKHIESDDDIKMHKLTTINHEVVKKGTIILSECGVEGFGKDIEDSCKTVTFQPMQIGSQEIKADEMVKSYIDDRLGLLTTPSK